MRFILGLDVYFKVVGRTKKFDEEFSFKTELYNILFNYVSIENRVIKPAKFFGLINGNDGRRLEGDWNDYGYALLTICCYLGEKLSKDDKIKEKEVIQLF